LNPSLIDADDQAPGGRAALKLNGYPNGLRSGPPRPGSGRTRRHITRRQRTGAVLIAAACVFAAVWYVPGIVSADGRSLAGTVTSNGVIYLNFSASGQLAKIRAHAGQRVRKGQLLATEADPAKTAVITADRAAITADEALVSAGSASAQVQLARDKAQLAVDRAQAAEARIVAPSAGTVVAVNGQPGETADATGIREYSAQPGAAVTQKPLFSLFPEGPQSGAGGSAGSSTSLPVIALRTSSTWQVTVLIPEGTVTSVRPGQAVTIDVPTAGMSAVPGRIQELLTTPVATPQGTAYQAVVTVLGHGQDSPPSGMAANVQLGS
jgi:multidrug efflux pump subunit AcrA (membrane-fusion protein)